MNKIASGKSNGSADFLAIKGAIFHKTKDLEVSIATTRLYTSAPELLEACKQALDALNEYELEYPESERASFKFLTDAIAKAEGR